MATKIVCDVCGKEARNKFSFKCHLNNILEGVYLNGYVDPEGNRVSGKEKVLDLCNKCYNEVLTPSILKLKELKNNLK